MSTVIKALVICLSINICLTLSSISIQGADGLSLFIDITNDTVTPTQQFNLLGNESVLPTNLQNGAIGGDNTIGTGITSTTGTLGYSFVDPIKMTFGFLILIMTCLFFPVYWGFALGLPIWFTFLLLVETIIGITALVMTIRGVPA